MPAVVDLLQIGDERIDEGLAVVAIANGVDGLAIGSCYQLDVFGRAAPALDFQSVHA